jgi:hypothetical protein
MRILQALEINYKVTCVYDDMTIILENEKEISRTCQDNRIKIDYYSPTFYPGIK